MMPVRVPASKRQELRIVRPVDRLFEKLTLVVSLLMVFVLLAGIPKIGLFPVSPLFFLVAAAFFFFSLHNRTLLIAAFKELPGALSWFLVLMLTIGIFKSSARPIVGCFEGFTVFSVVFCMMTYRAGTALLTTRSIALFYIASGAWMILSTLIPEPFATVRQYLYAGHLGRFELSELQMAYPTGLTFNHFTMGYQLSVGMVLTLLLFYFEKGRWKPFWLAGAFLSAAAVLLAGQRSVIPAVAIAFGMFLVHQRKMRMLVLAGLIAAAAFYLVEEKIVPTAIVETMSRKLEQQEDLGARFGWQLAALRIIAERPAGNIFDELYWEQEALDKGADFTYYGGKIKFVHNAYLGNALDYGWLGAALILLTLWYILRNLVMPVFDRAFSGCPSRPYALTCVLALVSVMVQALFHNANLFVIESSSWMIFSTTCAWVWLLKREKKAGC